MNQTSLKGAIAEQRIITELTELGIVCCQPVMPAAYDLVADFGGRLLRIQVKYVQLKNGVLEVPTSTIGRDGKRSDYVGKVDLFAVWCPCLKKSYWLPIGDASRTISRLRVHRAGNYQQTGVRWATNYEIRHIVGGSIAGHCPDAGAVT